MISLYDFSFLSLFFVLVFTLTITLLFASFDPCLFYHRLLSGKRQGVKSCVLMLAVPVLLCSVVLCPYSTIIICHPYFHVPSCLFPSAHVFVPFSMQPCIFPWPYVHALIFFLIYPTFSAKPNVFLYRRERRKRGAGEKREEVEKGGD